MKIEWVKSVRSIVTLMIVAMYCWLSCRGIIKAESFQTIAVMIITFYFTKQRGGNGNGTV